MSQNIENDLIIELIKKAQISKENSYSPYSKFRVGCSLLCADNTVVTGCNVENSSYGLCICAERVALTKAISQGIKKFKYCVVASDLADEFIRPCGACVQFLLEFGHDIKVICTKTDGSYDSRTVVELLPFNFNSSNLK